jgi:hypothetical protein
MSRSEDLLKDLNDSLKRTANATVTEYGYASIASSGGGTEIAAADTNRIGLTVMNNSDGIVFLSLGDTDPTAAYASATHAFTGVNTIKIQKGSFYEVPYRFTGRVAIIKYTMTKGSVTVTKIS